MLTLPDAMQLHDYQKRVANFCATHKNAILSVDMGLGKTASVLAWLDWYERRRNYSATAVIVAPKRVAENQWHTEAEKWGLDMLREAMVVVKGTPKQKAEALASERPIKIISRDNLKLIRGWAVEILILDELTSFKTFGSQRTKDIMSIQAMHKIGLTGTFLANGAIDIYSQAMAVGVEFAERNFFAWRATYFRDVLKGSGLQFSKWRPSVPLDKILEPIRGNIYTLTADDYLTIPEVSEVTHKVDVGNETYKAISEMDAFLSAEIGGEVVAFGEKAKFAKLQTLCNGFVYDEEGSAVRCEKSAKLSAVADLVQDCAEQGEAVLLFYAYREECDWLKEMLKARRLRIGDVRDKNFLERWNMGDYDVLFAHPASAGHGLNLQHGGRTIVWSTLTYNYEFFAQGNARLARQGQRNNVQIHYFIAGDTCEERVVKALSDKQLQQRQFLKITKK